MKELQGERGEGFEKGVMNGDGWV